MRAERGVAEHLALPGVVDELRGQTVERIRLGGAAPFVEPLLRIAGMRAERGRERSTLADVVREDERRGSARHTAAQMRARPRAPSSRSDPRTRIAPRALRRRMRGRRSRSRSSHARSVQRPVAAAPDRRRAAALTVQRPRGRSGEAPSSTLLAANRRLRARGESSRARGRARARYRHSRRSRRSFRRSLLRFTVMTMRSSAIHASPVALLLGRTLTICTSTSRLPSRRCAISTGEPGLDEQPLASVAQTSAASPTARRTLKRPARCPRCLVLSRRGRGRPSRASRPRALPSRLARWRRTTLRPSGSCPS